MRKVLRFDEDGNPVWCEKGAGLPKRAAPTPAVSDLCLGFTSHDLEEKVAERDLSGFKGRIEFKKDPELPWYSVHGNSWNDLNSYAESIGQPERNSRNGGGVIHTAESLAQAEQRVLEKYPRKVKA